MLRLKYLVLVCLGFLAACGGSVEAEGPRARAVTRQALGAEVSPSQLSFGNVRVNTVAVQRITLRNTGSTRLLLRNVVLEGSTTFALSGPLPVPLVLEPDGEMGSSVSLEVSFRPTQEGQQLGSLVFFTEDENTFSIQVALSGTGGIRPALSWSPSLVNFGARRVGTTTSETITIINTGSGPILLQSPTTTFGFSAAFSRSTPLLLPPGAQEELTVSFSPTVTAYLSGTLTLSTSDPDHGAISIALMGQGVEHPLITDPESLDFDAQEVGASRELPLRVANTGTTRVRVSSVTLSGANGFSVPNAPFDLDPHSSRLLPVTFTPGTEGNALAVLSLTSQDLRGSLDVALTGRGVKTRLKVLPGMFDFGERLVGTTAETALLLSNLGSREITVKELSLEGSGEHGFEVQTPPVPLVLAPGQSLSLPVRFSPRAERSDEVLLRIETGTRHTVALRGSGVRPVLDVSAPLLDFGTQRPGTATARTLTVRNLGSEVIHVAALKLASDVFVLNPSAAFELRPGQARDVKASFLPSRVGQAQAELLLESDNTSRPLARVLLSGVGVGEGVALSVDTTALDFGVQRVGTPVIRTVTVRNIGDVPLHIKSAAVTAGSAFSVTPAAPFKLAPEAEQVLTVTFTPAAAGAVTARLELFSDAANAPEASVDLAGTGVMSPFVLEPTALDFGPQAVETDSVVLTTTLRNLGILPLRVTALALSAKAPFRVDPSAPFAIAPGRSRDLSVRFRPPSAGAHTATLTLVTDAAHLPEATLSLQGSGVAPEEAGPAARGCAATGGGTAGTALLGLLALLRPRRGPAQG